MRARLNIIKTGVVLAIAAGALLAMLQPVTPQKLTAKVVAAPVNTPVPAVVQAPVAVSRPDAAPIKFTSAPVTADKFMPQEPEFVENDDGSFEVKAGRYSARLDDTEGLTYRPLNENDGTSPGTLKIKLRKVDRGEESVYDSTDYDLDDSGLAIKQRETVNYWRAIGMEEIFKARGDGVEQSFLLDNEPDGEGDLVFQCDFSTEGLTALKMGAQHRGGVFFADKSGKIAAKYGQVVVRDAGKDGIVCEPYVMDDGKTIAFAVPGDWLAKAEYPVLVDPLVGSDFRISPDNGIGVAPPTIAAGSGNYLVVWNDYRDGASLPRLYGSVVTQSGLSSISFPISNAIALPVPYRLQRTAVAFDGTNLAGGVV